MIIPLSEYAKINKKYYTSVVQKANRGGFKTAYKAGNRWLIDSDEPYPDNRIKTGKYVNWRKPSQADKPAD